MIVLTLVKQLMSLRTFQQQQGWYLLFTASSQRNLDF